MPATAINAKYAMPAAAATMAEGSAAALTIATNSAVGSSKVRSTSVCGRASITGSAS